MDSAEGGRFFGIPNCCRVAMPSGPEPPFDAESEKLREFRQVVWSAIGSAGERRHADDANDLDEVLRQAARFPNVTGAILDDFFQTPEQLGTDAPVARASLACLSAMRGRLHGFPARKLDLWMVWYTFQMDLPVQAHIDLCDVVTLWTWNGSELERLDENLHQCVERTPCKRRLAGCYLWNYGECRPLSRREMEHQLETYARWMERGALEGVVVCSNCTADLGLESVDLLRSWLAAVGERPACRPKPTT
jgi:hypothetical protein